MIDTKIKPYSNKIKNLFDDMKEKKIKIVVMSFTIKKTYFTIIDKLEENEKKVNPYAQMKIIFLKNNNEILSIEANFVKFLCTAEVLRDFFECNGKEVKNIFSFLFKIFLGNLPQEISLLKDDDKKILLNYINKNENEENKIYPTGLKRNGIKNDKLQNRTPYNLEKTRLLNPELYERFKGDNTISFCYTYIEKNKKNNFEIIKNFYKK